MNKIKKGDNVKVMRGKDAGKQGEVLGFKKLNRGTHQRHMVIVKGVNIAKKSQKPVQQLGITGGIIEIERPIDISNVMVIAGSKATRVGIKIDKDNKSRISKKTTKKI